jgi:hypothetical protein
MGDPKNIDQILSLLAWLRCRSARYGVESIESLLSLVQGYCVGSGANYSTFAELLYDSSRDYFGLDHQLLPAVAIRGKSPSKSCETALFYAWCDWITGENVEVLAESELSDAAIACFRNKQLHYHGADVIEIVPPPKYIYICRQNVGDGGNLIVFLDERRCRFYEICATSFESAIKRANSYIGVELLWVETRRVAIYGIHGTFAEKQE